MALAVALLLTGTVVLAFGAEAAIRGAAAFARAHGISQFLLGALLFGVDIESLGAAVTAAGRGQTEIASGGAFGTIVFLLSAGFGAALLASAKPVPSPGRSMVLAPLLPLAAGALALADGFVTRPEALALVATYAIYVGMVVREGRTLRTRTEELEREAGEGGRVPSWLLLAAGLAAVYAGAAILVSGGVRILELTGLSAGFVGAAIIGALASADEVLLEVLPVRRGAPELATGNLLGTVAAFSSGVVGIAALVRPLSVDSAAASAYLAAAALYTVVAVVFLARGRAGRLTGVFVMGLYVLWLVLAAGI